jgi:glycerol-3-phosphate dehydrogenase (NAD(P)+)
MSINKITSIAVLGDGGWGTTLSVLLSNKGYTVTLWGAFPENIAAIKKHSENKKFLPGIKVPAKIKVTSDLYTAIRNKELIILAVPSQHIRNVLKEIKSTDYDRKALYLSVTKGIEIKSKMRMSQVIHEELGKIKLAVLSGPTIALEVAKGVPTAAVVASHSLKTRKVIQNILMTDRFRIYTNDDVVGVELGGSLKNVIAIACGACDGLGFGTNTKAALLSRGLAEMSRLGNAMGAKTKTFYGISGLGDLVTTCISPFSRNRFVGEGLGKGKKLKSILNHQSGLAEGVPTAKSAYSLSLRYNVDMPIVREVYNVIYKNKSTLKAFKDLMGRKKKEE